MQFQDIHPKNILNNYYINYIIICALNLLSVVYEDNIIQYMLCYKHGS